MWSREMMLPTEVSVSVFDAQATGSRHRVGDRYALVYSGRLGPYPPLRKGGRSASQRMVEVGLA